jgi:hypothetical protein
MESGEVREPELQGMLRSSPGTPATVRAFCREYFFSRKNGFELLDAPGPFLTWLISLLHGSPVTAPDLSNEVWSSLLALLAPHGVLPYLSHLVSKAPHDSRPPGFVVEKMKQSYIWSSYHTEHALKQSAEVSASCREEGVNVLVMKSPAIGLAVYPNAALRTGGDIDVLVSPDEYETCKKVLLEQGYELRYDTFRVMPEFYHHACYFPPDERYKVIELHWRPVFLPGPGDSVSARDLLARSGTLLTRYGEIRAFDPVDAFFYCAIHMSLFHEPVLRLSWVCDITRFADEITRRGVWPDVLRRSAEWQGRSAAKRATGLAGQWTGLQLPEEYDFPSWPVQGDDEIFAQDHMERRRAGKEFLLNQILARTPTVRNKVRATYHWMFRPDLIHDCHPGLSLWEYPSAYARQFYSNFRQIRWE